MATTGAVRAMNRNRIREYARGRAEVRIAEAARDTGMSNPTVSRMIADLVKAGEMMEAGSCASTGGRRAAAYRLNPAYLAYLLIRVEGDLLRWQARDYVGAPMESGAEEVPSGMVARLDRLLLEARARFPMLRAAYLGVAGMVSGGKIARMTRKHELEGLNVSAHFSELFSREKLADIPVFVENDTNLVASGRWSRLGLSSGAIVVLYGFGTGAGAGLMIDGRLWRGRNGLPGELGFFPALHRPSGPVADQQTEFFTQLVCMYASVVDPDRIVLYGSLLRGSLAMEALRKRCEELLPEGCAPTLEYSDEWDEDYLLGMDNETRAKLGIR